MTDVGFLLLILAAGIAAIGGTVADELGARGLPESLQVARTQAKDTVLALCKRHPVLYFLRLALWFGYLGALVALALFKPWSPLVYLLLSLGWTLLSVLDAPLILSRPQVFFYELSLLLNGAIIALCFASPLSVRFMIG